MYSLLDSAELAGLDPAVYLEAAVQASKLPSTAKSSRSPTSSPTSVKWRWKSKSRDVSATSKSP